MKYKKISYNAKTRKHISNPYHSLTHEELLEKAEIGKFANGYKIERLKNGRIFLSPNNNTLK